MTLELMQISGVNNGESVRLRTFTTPLAKPCPLSRKAVRATQKGGGGLKMSVKTRLAPKSKVPPHPNFFIFVLVYEFLKNK